MSHYHPSTQQCRVHTQKAFFRHATDNRAAAAFHCCYTVASRHDFSYIVCTTPSRSWGAPVPYPDPASAIGPHAELWPKMFPAHWADFWAKTRSEVLVLGGTGPAGPKTHKSQPPPKPTCHSLTNSHKNTVRVACHALSVQHRATRRAVLAPQRGRRGRGTPRHPQ